MFSYLLVVVLLPAVVFGHHHIVPCPGGVPPPTAIRIPICSGFPCNITRDAIIAYEVDFAATHSTDTLTLSITANIFGEERPVILPPGESNACNSLIGGACPVTAGEPLTQGTTLPVFSQYHGGVRAVVRFQISDTMHGHEHICVCTLVDFIIH